MKTSHWVQIERIFHQLMEKPEAARESCAREMASCDEDYYELVKLLNAARAAQGFMETSIGNESFSPRLLPGDRLGVWTVLRNIGSGGMGDVYLAERDDGSFRQIAALKTARTEEVRYLERFLKERQILAQLEHSNICRLIDGGTSSDEIPYIVMELVQGRPLTDYAQSHALSEKQRLDLIKQACDAVSYAHGRLILHRDLKPANVLVTGVGQVKVIDFGIAGLLAESEDELVPVTRAYAAPEQIKGKAISTAADIFGLGCLAHELISEERLGVERQISEKLPKDLRAIIEKSLQENPSDRYATAQALAEDISRYQQGEAVLAREGGTLYKIGKSFSRYRVAYAGFALFLLSLIGGLVGTYSQMTVAQTALVKAQQAELDREFEARRLQGYFYGLQALYGGDAESGDAIDPAKIDRSMIKLAETARKRFDGKSLDDAFLLYSMGEVLASRYDFEKAAHFLEPLENLALESAISKSLSFEARSDLGRIWVELGRNDEALDLIRRLLEERRREGFLYDLSHVQDVQGLARLTGLKSDRDQSIAVAELTIENLNQELADPADMSWLYNQIAITHFADDDIPKALTAFEKSFEAQRSLGIKSLEDITGATNLAVFQIYFGWDGDKPLSYLSDYLEPAIEDFGATDVYAFIQGLRGEAALMEGKWSLANDVLKDGLPKIDDNRDFRDGWYYEMVVMRVRALAQLRDLSEARRILDKALIEFETEENADWGFTSCKLRVIIGYLRTFEGDKAIGASQFEVGVERCQKTSEIGWDKEKVIPRWLDDLRAEMRKAGQ